MDDAKIDKNQEMSDRDHAELLNLFQITIDDIERAKRWGWIVAYGTITIQAAILVFFPQMII